MKAISFPEASDAEWKETAVKSLRGMPFEKLITKTLEGVEIHPLYTQETLKKLHNKLDTMTATIRHTKNTSSWTIAQDNYAGSDTDFLKALTDSIERGNEAIVYNGDRPLNWSKSVLEELSELIVKYPVVFTNLRKDDQILQLFENVSATDRDKVQGYVLGEEIDLTDFSQIRTESIDLIQEHLDGADAVTELALTLAKAAEKAGTYQNFDAFSKNVLVRYALDTEFFLEIAKLRAFRILWQTFAEAYGEKTYQTVPVYAENSLRTYSKLDEYVNLLRAGNETLAGVLGGVDMMSVYPHDILTGPTALSVRFARNLQLIIKEETYVDDVIDPAGGSYFVESLTNDFVELAWDLFLDIEAQGGYSEYRASGELEKLLNEKRTKREQAVATNKKSLIGTNIYADLTTPAKETQGAVTVKNRLSEPFEEFRAHFKNKQPKVVLLTFGELKDFKPRTDFVSGFLATAGIEAEHSPAFETVEAGRKWIKENDFDYGVICVSAKATEAVVDELITDFPNDKLIDVAGNYAEDLVERWKDAGVNDLVYQGQNRVEKINALKEVWEGAGANE